MEGIIIITGMVVAALFIINSPKKSNTSIDVRREYSNISEEIDRVHTESNNLSSFGSWWIKDKTERQSEIEETKQRSILDTLKNKSAAQDELVRMESVSALREDRIEAERVQIKTRNELNLASIATSQKSITIAHSDEKRTAIATEAGLSLTDYDSLAYKGRDLEIDHKANEKDTKLQHFDTQEKNDIEVMFIGAKNREDVSYKKSISAIESSRIIDEFNNKVSQEIKLAETKTAEEIKIQDNESKIKINEAKQLEADRLENEYTDTMNTLKAIEAEKKLVYREDEILLEQIEKLLNKITEIKKSKYSEKKKQTLIKDHETVIAKYRRQLNEGQAGTPKEASGKDNKTDESPVTDFNQHKRKGN